MCEGAREKSQEVTKGSLFNLFKQNIARQNQYNNLSYIAMYWFITSLVFLYGFWEHSMLKGILFVFMSVIFIFGPIVAMILTVIKYPIPPKHIRCASWFIPAIMLIIILGWVAIELEHARTSKCQYITAFAIVGHILLFNFVLYREDVTKLTKSQSLSLMHNRYLKYFHSFVWLIVVALLGYSTWQLTKTQLHLAVEPELTIKDTPIMSYHPDYPLWRVLLQTGVAVFFGIILVSQAFFVKLKQIEDSIEQANG